VLTALAVGVLLMAGCTGHHDSSRAGRGTTTTSLPPQGSDCRKELTSATRRVLDASGFTVVQDPWRESGHGPTVSGGGAATITFQSPDREHVVPASTGRGAVVELVVIGRTWWEGSARQGWARFTTHAPSDPLDWLAVPERTSHATWDGAVCRFTATSRYGSVVGGASLSGPYLSELAMTLHDRAMTIKMHYRVSDVGSSPPVSAPT
jgi:hypothetical protein